MQNLVGVRIADAAEEPRIGQGALERVVFPPQDGAKLCRGRLQHLEPAGIVLGQLNFSTDEVERLRMQIVSGLKEQETSARTVAERRFLKTLYPEGHPYHIWPSGTEDTVGSITRDDLVAFYRRYFRPDTLVVAIAGDVVKIWIEKIGTLTNKMA